MSGLGEGTLNPQGRPRLRQAGGTVISRILAASSPAGLRSQRHRSCHRSGSQ